MVTVKYSLTDFVYIAVKVIVSNAAVQNDTDYCKWLRYKTDNCLFIKYSIMKMEMKQTILLDSFEVVNAGNWRFVRYF